MATTILVEPDPGGHRFQAVANVARVAARSGGVLLLTSRGATGTPAFLDYLGDVDLEVEEVFDEIYPPTREMATLVGERCRTGTVDTVVVMDSDQALKRWWYVAPRALRGTRPRVVFMVTRYPAELSLGDRRSWWLRVTKATLVLAAMGTGRLHRAAGFAGRDNTAEGLVVKRLRDPDVCTAHSRDRAALRDALDLPLDRSIAGIFGVVSAPKNARLIWEAMGVEGLEADLLLAGSLDAEVAAWAAKLPEEARGRVIVRDGFLPSAVLDQAVAAVDVVPIAHTYNGPSGIMGKALAAGVPVVTAGSEVRARELVATDAGELSSLDVASLGAAIRRALERDPDEPRRSTVPPATPEEFAERLLGIDGDGLVARRRRRRGR